MSAFKEWITAQDSNCWEERNKFSEPCKYLSSLPREIPSLRTGQENPESRGLNELRRQSSEYGEAKAAKVFWDTILGIRELQRENSRYMQVSTQVLGWVIICILWEGAIKSENERSKQNNPWSLHRAGNCCILNGQSGKTFSYRTPNRVLRKLLSQKWAKGALNIWSEWK